MAESKSPQRLGPRSHAGPRAVRVEINFNVEQALHEDQTQAVVSYDRRRREVVFPVAPKKPGVYVFEARGPLESTNSADALLAVYVGQARNLRKRLRAYGRAGRFKLGQCSGRKTERYVAARLRHHLTHGATVAVYWVRGARVTINGQEPPYGFGTLEEVDTRLMVESALVHSYRQHGLAFDIINRGVRKPKPDSETVALLRELGIPEDEAA